MTVHKRTPTNQWPTCNICSKRFMTTGSLKRHISDVHGIWAEECPWCLEFTYRCRNLDYKGATHKVCSKCYYEFGQKRKTPESDMVKYLADNISFPIASADVMVHDATCTVERPDVMYASPGERIIVVECDQNQHSTYTCEEARMSRISENLSNSSIAFIRFNPTNYVPPMDEKCLSLTERYSILVREINAIRKRSSKDEEKRPFIEVIYLFYDQNNPVIVQSLPKKFVYH